MGDRYVVSLVDPGNRVAVQSPPPFLQLAEVPDAVMIGVRNLEALPDQGHGWVITITKQENAVVDLGSSYRRPLAIAR